MANLRQLLVEYAELDKHTVDEIIVQCEAEWAPLIYQRLSDEQASELIEKLIGIPDWTKAKPA